MFVTWQNVVPTAIALAERLRETKVAVDAALSALVTSDPVGVYVDWSGKQASLDTDIPAVARLVSCVLPCGVNRHTEDRWVKIAYSPFVRGFGEILNFLPGPKNTLPGMASPLASGLTSGLLGAGAGYLGGKAIAHFFPNSWDKKKLPRNMAILGGLIGPTLAVGQSAENWTSGRPLNSNAVLEGNRNDMPKLASLSETRVQASLAVIKAAFEQQNNSGSGLFGSPGPTTGLQSGFGVNIDAFGRTMWEAGASPSLAGASMGILGAAQQMPGGIGPGWVTPVQMGQLAMRMGAGYASGAIAGKVLSALVGISDSAQDQLKRTGQYLSLVQGVLPAVYGR